jgi:methenyltetrahydrofolate cyclohydrolase
MQIGELRIEQLVEALGDRTSPPAGGAAAALTGAMAAGLAELAARFALDEQAVATARALRDRLLALADEDARTYAQFLATGSDIDRRRTIDVPRSIADAARAVEVVAARMRERLRSAVAGDAIAAGELARAAASVAESLAAFNTGGDPLR